MCRDFRTGDVEMAEREGFEPSIPVKVYTLSRGAPSATRPPLQKVRDHTNIRSEFKGLCVIGFSRGGMTKAFRREFDQVVAI